MLSVPSQPGENRGERLGEFENRSVKTRDAVESFQLLENSHKLCPGKTIYEARTVNSFNLETANNMAHVIFVLHSAMKTHLLTNQNARTIQIIL